MEHVEQVHDFYARTHARRAVWAWARRSRATFVLEEGKRDGRQDDVMHPTGIRSSFEVIEAIQILAQSPQRRPCGSGRHTDSFLDSKQSTSAMSQAVPIRTESI